MYSTYWLKPRLDGSSGTLVSKLSHHSTLKVWFAGATTSGDGLGLGGGSANIASPRITPVVPSETAATKTARKISARRGKRLPINAAARPRCASSLLVAGDFALRPTRSAMRPDTPPRGAKMVGNDRSAIGPKITSVQETTHAMIEMMTHAPRRAHHSRSSSLTRWLWLDSPT